MQEEIRASKRATTVHIEHGIPRVIITHIHTVIDRRYTPGQNAFSRGICEQWKQKIECLRVSIRSRG